MHLLPKIIEKPLILKNTHPDEKNIKPYILLPDHQKRVRILVKDIVFLEGVRNYTLFHLRDGERFISTRTLKKYEEELAIQGFHRIHKSYVINLNHLTSYDKEEGSYVILRNEMKIMVARRKQKDFLLMIKTFLFG